MGGAFLVLFISWIVSLVFGAAEASPGEVWLALTTDVKGDTVTMIREIRLPRVVAALCVGSALAVSGAVMQGLTRNPLADPGLIGLTAGANAALAVTMALMPAVSVFGTMIACFIGAAAGGWLVLGIGAVKKGGLSPFRMVLAGAAVSAFLYAVAQGVGLYFKISKDVTMWTAGGLVGVSWSQVAVIMPFIMAGIGMVLFLSRHLTILRLNRELAIGLGQRVTWVKSALFLITIMLAGASVALVGNMVFVGLMVPHIVRAVVGTDYRFILPMSAVTGAAFMLLADTAGRTVHAPYETPVAAIVALMGLPFFLFIVRKGGASIQ
nr:iron ABC transporter permease [Melghirimyces profundicolus]